MGLACNLLAAISGSPLIADAALVPKYPGPLPWGIRPGLEVPLRERTRLAGPVLHGVEYPQHGPVALAASRW